jgi:hypothetical protein
MPIESQSRVNREPIESQSRANRESIESQSRVNRETIESQSRVNRGSIESQSRVNRESIESQSRVNRVNRSESIENQSRTNRVRETHLSGLAWLGPRFHAVELDPMTVRVFQGTARKRRARWGWFRLSCTPVPKGTVIAFRTMAFSVESIVEPFAEDKLE